jgi:gas vesicle protein
MSRREKARTVIIERGSSALWWFAVGGALGAGLALLFAPHSGDRTRSIVGRKLNKLRDAADEALEGLRGALSTEEPLVHRSLAKSDDDGDEPVEAAVAEDVEEVEDEEEEEEEEEVEQPEAPGNSRRGAASARQELERRLAEARARRQRALADEDEEPVA